ncbi:MAG: DUF115 domain-containing protein, partial [Treponema sp.]|nr:DUF115 domain-containing protein [Treponema sp.]
MSSSISGTPINPSESPREFPANRGFSVYYLGKTLLSRIDPISQAERLAEEVPIRDGTLYFCPSPLYGYGLDRILKKLGKHSAILCAEADGQLFDLSAKNMAGLLEGEKLLSGELKPISLVKTGAGSEAALCAFVRKTWEGGGRFRRVEVLRLTGGWQLFPELYESLADHLRRDLATSWGNAMTLIKLGRLYARNTVRNLALLPGAGDIGALDFGADPVLVLGAGPSLDGVLEALERKFGPNLGDPQSRPFRILCADTCIPCVRERGIRPDLAVILESQHWNLGDFSGARDWGIPSALDLSCLPASTRVLGGQTSLFMIPWTKLRFFTRLEKERLLPSRLSPLGSVGLTAAELAMNLSSGPVIAGGLDFSFTLDSYHARSTPGHRTRLIKCCRFNSLINAAAAYRTGVFRAVSKTGLSVLSDPAMRRYRDLFEQEFGASSRIYDIAGPGLSLGVRILSPEEACGVLAQEIHWEKGPGGKAREKRPGGLGRDREGVKNRLAAFIEKEAAALLRLRDFLTGKVQPGPEEIETLLDEADYLWAHFPECAGAGGRR